MGLQLEMCQVFLQQNLTSRTCPRKLAGAVVTENSVGSENAEVAIVRAIKVATTMSSLFIALFAFAASSFRTRGALQAGILAYGQRSQTH
jgi:hypothetical protein